MNVNCGPRVEASSSVFLYYVSVFSSVRKEVKLRGGRAGSLVVVRSSEPQLVICCQFAPTVLCTGIWPLAAAGWTGLGRTEHRATSMSNRDSDSSLSLAAGSLTLRRNVVLRF